jgi:2,3-dimethylmalate lyase
VREYESAGVAALHIEDQVAPKRCGHMSGKDVIDAAEMVEKVRAAVEARREVLIIARTDARAVEGLDAALARARSYLDAGADALFVEAPENEDEIAAVAAAFPGVPLVFNRVDGGRTPLLGLDRIAELGFSLVILPVTPLFAAAAAVRDTLARLRAGDEGEVPLQFDEFTDLIGLPDAQRLERRYAV